MATSTRSRLTGERPQQGVTPDSLLALHEAGYRAVLDRIGAGRVLDVGCGQGFESARFLADDRQVVGVDYSADAVGTAAARYGARGLRVARTNALDLGLRAASFDGVCSSHLIEHFTDARAARRRARTRAPRRRGGLCAHAEQTGRLREPLPPPSLRPHRVTGDARAPLRRRVAGRRGRGAPREGRLRGAARQGEQAAPPRRLRRAPPHSVRRGTSGRTRGCSRSPTSWSPAATRAE